MNMNNNTISDFNVSYLSARVEQNINSDSNRPWPKVAVYLCELSWGKSYLDAGKLPSGDSMAIHFWLSSTGYLLLES